MSRHRPDTRRILNECVQASEVAAPEAWMADIHWTIEYRDAHLRVT